MLGSYPLHSSALLVPLSMPLPKYHELMLPLLQVLERSEACPLSTLYPSLAKHFNLSPEEENELYPSGKTTPVFNDRVGWARSYLHKAGLVASPQRNLWRITPEGKRLLANPPETLTLQYLKTHYPCFEGWYRATTKPAEPTASPHSTGTDGASADWADMSSDFSPEEQIEQHVAQLQNALAKELLEQIKAKPPRFFESLVCQLIVAMGYGNSFKELHEAIVQNNGHSGDEGIDGVIKQDVLGLDTVYLQAKRWDKGSVGRPDIQQFCGALVGKNAHKGVFITTSYFTKQAKDYAAQLSKTVILIEGSQLTELMIRYNIGVKNHSTYTLKRVDEDFFVDY